MKSVTGARSLFGLAARQEWRHVAVWTIGNIVLFVSQGWSVDRLYTSHQELAAAAATMADNPALVALAGPARALDTTGGQVAWQAGAFGAVVAGLMSMLIVVRHTRREEESGRDELVRSGVVDRRAPMFAAAAVMIVADIVMGAGLTASLLAYGLPGPGSAALGIGTAACGMLFGALALVAAQLAATSRGAYTVVGTGIALSYCLRAVGDVTGGTLSWLSPIGWAQAMRSYAGEVWWPTALLVSSTVVMLSLASVLFASRDAGTGILATPASGPPAAKPGLGGPLGLAWRLERITVLGWSVGMFATGIAYGSIGDDVEDVMGSSDLSRELLSAGAGDVVDAFYAMAALTLALVCSGFTIATVLHLRSVEVAGIADLLLATPLSRVRWGLATLTVALVGSSIIVLVGGLGLASGLGLATGNPARFGPLVGAALLQGAGVGCTACVAWLAYGIGRACAAWAWGSLTYVVFVAFFADAMALPGWITWWSPFAHLPSAPADSVTVMPVAGVIAAGLVFVVAGTAALRRRDLG